MRHLNFQRLDHAIHEPEDSASVVQRFWWISYWARLSHQGGLWLVAVMLSGNLAEITWAAAGGQSFVIHETFQQHTVQERLNNPSTHGIVGLDLLIQPRHYPLVHGVFRGTPAASQGLLPGDVILSINGTATLGKNVNQVDAMISDVPGDRVNLTVQRGPQLAQVHLVVAALEKLSPNLRSNFSGLFGNEP